MVLKPDEVTYLKKGRKVTVEISDGDVRMLKRNYCGVYELYQEGNFLDVEYFEDLTLFKNRYGTLHKKFPIYNLTNQRADIFPVIENVDIKEVFKWFGEYGKIIYNGLKTVENVDVSYYTWISDMDGTVSTFQVIKLGKNRMINIPVKSLKKQTA